MKVIGLFAGIGGIEHGLAESGHQTELLCELDVGARRILSNEFPSVPLVADVRDLRKIPHVDVVAAGFPCQDVSQAGNKAGITGAHSGLIGQVFRLLRPRATRPRWLFLENVPFMLHLDGGNAMSYLTQSLESLGYTWAYRVVDARAFGVPQRRQRIVLLASRSDDPRPVLFGSSVDAPVEINQRGPVEHGCYGFYWTEGSRGIGWAADAVPTLKGGSRLGIPSPPAVWVPETGEIGTIDLRDAERLQGFRADYTLSAASIGNGKAGTRWTLVGNAVCVPMSAWVGAQLTSPPSFSPTVFTPLEEGGWPKAAWGHKGKTYSADVSMWPTRPKLPKLLEFLNYPLRPLSVKATEGFRRRALAGRLRYNPMFLSALSDHLTTFDRNRAA
jgi:DNA (cytosine-5)-methyltransferase 1